MLARISVDTAALRENVRALERLVAPARVAAVVKANAYGHGLSLVAPATADCVAAFGVYAPSEATELRALGITAPIHLLGPVAPHEIHAALEARAILPVWSRGAWLRDLVAAARTFGERVAVQVKVDTGLTRLGVAPAEASALLAHLEHAPVLEVVGGYTHIASAEELDSRFTLDQLARFESALPPGSVPLRHVAASAPAMLWPTTRLDLIRAGIALYGIWPSSGTRKRMQAQLALRPALSWRTELVVVRDVAAETPIGYGSTYRPPFDTRIGVLPIGYAEGLARGLSNVGEVLVDGVRCPIVGRVCMNMTFVDLANAPAAHVGSRVTLIGAEVAPDGATSELPIDEMANRLETIAYEVAARLPESIPRATGSYLLGEYTATV